MLYTYFPLFWQFFSPPELKWQNSLEPYIYLFWQMYFHT